MLSMMCLKTLLKKKFLIKTMRVRIPAFNLRLLRYFSGYLFLYIWECFNHACLCNFVFSLLSQMPVSTIPEMVEEEQKQDTPNVEHASKGAAYEERSTADSPPKGNLEGNQQDPPHIEVNDQVTEGSRKEDDIAIEYGPGEKDKVKPTLSKSDEPEQQNPNPEGNSGASTQKSPSPEQADMNQ
jgi:hypothetical protein